MTIRKSKQAQVFSDTVTNVKPDNELIVITNSARYKVSLGAHPSSSLNGVIIKPNETIAINKEQFRSIQKLIHVGVISILETHSYDN